jgi:hypothetical protein
MGSFRQITENDPIRQYAWPLLVYDANQVIASGTACVIGQQLALTAKHVVEDYMDRFGLDRKPCGGSDARFAVVLHQQVGSQEFLWTADKIWLCALTDAALLHLSPWPKSDVRPRPPWRRWTMSLFPPPPGTEIAAFGYHDTTAEITKDGPIAWRVDASTAMGHVLEIHRLQRDSSRLRFPVYRLDARFDASMSGGPVVNNSTGELCGLICSALPPSLDDQEGSEISYAATLWPVMGTVMQQDEAPVDHIPLLKLAETGAIHAPDWKRVACSSIRDNGHTVDLHVEFPKIDGSFDSYTPEAGGTVAVGFSFSIDGVLQGRFMVKVASSSFQISPLNPVFSGPWDEGDFAKIVRQYICSLGAMKNFRMAAQHLGRGRSTHGASSNI